MPLSAECPECGTRYNVPDRLAGKRAKCKKCGAPMSIPAPVGDIGFAPEEDSLAALQDLARESGEPPAAPPAGAGGRRQIPAAPPGWTPESVIVEKESSRPRSLWMEGSGRWAPKSGGAFAGLVRKLVLLCVVAGIAAGGWYLYTNYSRQAANMIASAKNSVTGGSEQSAEGSTDSAAEQLTAPMTETEGNRAESAEHLRQIHAAITAHLAGTNGHWPVDLGTLQREQPLDARALRSPFGPAFAAGDYVYKPYVAQATPGPEVVIAYDNAEFSNGDGANVLFGSGEVRWLDRAAVEAALQQSEGIRATALQQHEEQVAIRRQQEQRRAQQQVADGGGANGDGNDASGDALRVGGRHNLAERIRASARGFARHVQDLAVRRGTEQLIRPVTPASVVAVLVRGAQGDTIEVFDGKSAEPVQAAHFQAEQQFRNNPGAYALSPDGKLVARLASFPKLKAAIYSFDKNSDVTSIDLGVKFGDPTLIGFMSPDRFLVRWHKLGEHGIEVWDAKTGKRGRQLPLFRVDPPPAPGSEAVSSDGRSYALLSRNPPRASVRGRPQADLGLSVLVYDVIGGSAQPRMLAVPVLTNQPGIQAAGLAFSPDRTRLALLLVDPHRRGVVVTWNLATGKPLPERVLPEKIDPPRIGFGRARSLDWVADGRALLVAGRIIMNPETGETLAVLDAGNVHGQAVTNDSVVHLAHGEFGELRGLAVVELNEVRFPEKPGVPRRASAAPAR